jgi:putative chitinase
MVKEMVAILFPATKNIDEVVGIIEKYRMKFGLDTGLRLAQFLAQVREETGPEFKVIRENLNYKEETALKLFKNMTVADAEKYARDENTPIADQVAIANIAYANKLGNGIADTDGDGKLDADDDGWKYRGAGCLQITGKSNFAEVQKRVLAKTGTECNPDTLEGFLLFGMAYWLWRDCYRAADTGNPDKVTEIVNKATLSYANRRKYFDSIKHLI